MLEAIQTNTTTSLTYNATAWNLYAISPQTSNYLACF